MLPNPSTARARTTNAAMFGQESLIAGGTLMEGVGSAVGIMHRVPATCTNDNRRCPGIAIAPAATLSGQGICGLPCRCFRCSPQPGLALACAYWPWYVRILDLLRMRMRPRPRPALATHMGLQPDRPAPRPQKHIYRLLSCVYKSHMLSRIINADPD